MKKHSEAVYVKYSIQEIELREARIDAAKCSYIY